MMVFTQVVFRMLCVYRFSIEIATKIILLEHVSTVIYCQITGICIQVVHV